jgi:hypothetical protein
VRRPGAATLGEISIHFTALEAGTGTIGLADNVHHLPFFFTMTLVTILSYANIFQVR